MKLVWSGIAAAWMLTASSGAIAQALTWRVSETAGPVTVRHGTDARPAQRGAALSEGDTVTTGAGGRAVLVHERDFVTVAPNSRVEVPTRQAATGLTKLIQTIGNAVYKIEKLGVPHFGVNTPYLAAVVKGTTFSVTVDASGSALQVTEGAVEVATLDGGARDLVRPGDLATIAAGDLHRLRVEGDRERTIDSPARASGAPAADASPAPASPPSETTSDEIADVPQPTPDMGQVAIAEAIASKPTDLSAATGGLLSGTVGTPTVAATAVVAALTATEVKTTLAAVTGTLAGGTADKVAVERPGADVATAKAPSDATAVNAAGPARDLGKDAGKNGDGLAKDVEKAGQGAQKDAKDAPKETDKADKDAQKDADKVAKDADKAAKDSLKDADRAGKDADKAAKDADKDADKAAKDAQKDAEKAAKDAQKDADDAAKEAKKAADDARKAAEDAVKKLLDDGKKVVEKLVDTPSKPGKDLKKLRLDLDREDDRRRDKDD